MSRDRSLYAWRDQRYHLKQAKAHQKEIQRSVNLTKTAVLFKTLKTEKPQQDCLAAIVVKISRACKDMPPSVVTSIIMLATLALLISQANAQESPVGKPNALNSVSTERLNIEVSASTTSQASIAVGSFASSIVTPQQSFASQQWARSLEVTEELRIVATDNQIRFYTQQMFTAIDKLYETSVPNKRHMDYALATQLTLRLVPEDPNQPGTYRYQIADHCVEIPIPYGPSYRRAGITGKNFFSESFINNFMHELQHSSVAIANSDENCNLTLEFEKYLRHLRKNPPAIPKDIQEAEKTLKQVRKGQKYVLTHIASLLPPEGEYVDFTKQYGDIRETARFFKKKHKDPTEENAKKELAYLQHLLKDYQPRRHTVKISAQLAKEVVAALKENKLYAGKEKEGDVVYIDQVEERYSRIYGRGYLVKNPQDKVRAFVEETRWNRDIMPQKYAGIFSKSGCAYEMLAAESEAHIYGTIDLAVIEKIYSGLFQLNENNKAASRCQPKIG